MTPLQQLASMSATDAETLVVQPYDKGSMDEVCNAILNADLGVNPSIQGDIIRVKVPSLTAVSEM